MLQFNMIFILLGLFLNDLIPPTITDARDVIFIGLSAPSLVFTNMGDVIEIGPPMTNTVKVYDFGDRSVREVVLSNYGDIFNIGSSPTEPAKKLDRRSSIMRWFRPSGGSGGPVR